LKTIADTIAEKISKTPFSKGRIEGSGDTGWIVIDFKDIIVHLFSPEKRNYYKLEDLWNDGKTLLRLQ
jgi:ribosome-associated protein